MAAGIGAINRVADAINVSIYPARAKRTKVVRVAKAHQRQMISPVSVAGMKATADRITTFAIVAEQTTVHVLCL